MLLHTKTKFTFFLSEESQKRHFLETGQKGPTNGTVELDLTLLTPEQRQKLLDYTEFLMESRTGSYDRDFATFSIERSGTYFPYSVPRIDSKRVVFDTPPTVDDTFAHIDRMMAEYAAAKQQLAVSLAEHKAAGAAYEAQKEAERKAEREAAERARKEAAIINWKDDGTAIVDLETVIFSASGDKTDKGGWILEVSGINRDDKYKMFVGEYVEKGTVEVTRQRRVYLVASKSGSRKYQTTTYRVVLMTDLGTLERTDITTDDNKPGWQLRIRDQVAELLV